MPIKSTVIPQSTAGLRADIDDHNLRHEDGGADEIDVTGLTGLPDISNLAVVGHGSYTGNGTQNRPIAHGLGVVPKFIIWQEVVIDRGFILQLRDTVHQRLNANNHTNHTVTVWDATSFYVGESGGGQNNVNARVINWVAFG